MDRSQNFLLNVEKILLLQLLHEACSHMVERINDMGNQRKACFLPCKGQWGRGGEVGKNNDKGTSVRLLSHSLAPLAGDAGVLQNIKITLRAVIWRRRWQLEKAMAPTPVLLPEKSHGRRSLVGEEQDTTERLHFHFSLSCIGEGNGNPLQRSCLENPRDSGAWWAAVYGVAQSRTRRKQLSSSSSSD